MRGRGKQKNYYQVTMNEIKCFLLQQRKLCMLIFNQKLFLLWFPKSIRAVGPYRFRDSAPFPEKSGQGVGRGGYRRWDGRGEWGGGGGSQLGRRSQWSFPSSSSLLRNRRPANLVGSVVIVVSFYEKMRAAPRCAYAHYTAGGRCGAYRPQIGPGVPRQLLA